MIHLVALALWIASAVIVVTQKDVAARDEQFKNLRVAWLLFCLGSFLCICGW